MRRAATVGIFPTDELDRKTKRSNDSPYPAAERKQKQQTSLKGRVQKHAWVLAFSCWNASWTMQHTSRFVHTELDFFLQQHKQARTTAVVVVCQKYTRVSFQACVAAQSCCVCTKGTASPLGRFNLKVPLMLKIPTF